ncbi:SCO6745 family protein [Yinghuangia sp. YIM S09857]|uniref:SCO6745 family protein n=1 Tax=Yinghuangia sp. YIM S09857 TaxID=3436929 RepID=UPI003F529880
MTTADLPDSARRLWRAIEPVHGVAYYAPEPAEASRSLGLVGYWMGYFVGRLAPVGAVDAPVAQALSFAFAPRRVAGALPEAWAITTPEKAVRARLDAVSAALGRAMTEVPGSSGRPPLVLGTAPEEEAGAPAAAAPSPSVSREDLARLVELLERAVEGCTYEGRVLAAAWSGVPRPDDLEGRLWLATAVLREHRGDGHIVAVAHHGLTGLEAGVAHVATGQVTREIIQGTRGWTDAEWTDAEQRLAERGLLDREGRLTEAGRELRASVEAATDRLACGPVERLGADGVAEAVGLALRLGRRISDDGLFPVPNPIGVPRP